MRPARSQTAACGLRAVVVAGGRGTRLAPLTETIPKPLVPIGDLALLDHLLAWLDRFAVAEVTLTLGHLAAAVRAHFDGSASHARRPPLRFVEEARPTGTAGSLALVPGLDRTFLVVNGDLLTDLDLDALVGFHRAQAAAMTIATRDLTVRLEEGVLDLDGPAVSAYREKPELRYPVSMGIYVCEPAVLRHLPAGGACDMPELVARLLAAGEHVCAHATRCVWLDVGRPRDLAAARELVAAHPERFGHA